MVSMALQLPRWLTGAFGPLCLLLPFGIAVFLYDHDSVKRLPVVGALPWGRVIGNTGLQAEARFVAEQLPWVQRKSPRTEARGLFIEIMPAATYSPTHFRMQYHRRYQA